MRVIYLGSMWSLPYVDIIKQQSIPVLGGKAIKVQAAYNLHCSVVVNIDNICVS